MVKLPTPPWARRREVCPNCLDRIADQRALVCVRCGYQLRLPRLAVVGLVALAAGTTCLLLSAMIHPPNAWPAMPFGLKIPFLESPSPADLQSLFAWLGGFLLLFGIVLASVGAYQVRRRTERVIRGSRPA